MNVKEIRNRLGLNQCNFAHVIGTTPAAVSRWECNRAAPTGTHKILLERFDVASRASKDVLIRETGGFDNWKEACNVCLFGRGSTFVLYLLLRVSFENKP